MSNEAALDEVIPHPDLRHINFFNGRLLTSGDLQAEQAVQHAHDAQLGTAAGAGVISGLRVSNVSTGTASMVLVTEGLALNRAGQTLELRCDQRVVLAASLDPGKRDACVFGDCETQPAGASLSSGTGYYVLTLAPASIPQGRAPVSGLGNDLAPCNSRYWTEGVKFRLMRLQVTAGNNPLLARNRVAFQCFGWPEKTARAFIDAAGAEQTYVGYGYEEKIDGFTGSPTEVPLAVLQWTSSGLGVIDAWPVRRRVNRRDSGDAWDPLVSDRRAAEGEAMLQHFQEQIRSLLMDSAARTAPASSRFAYLPAAGFLPVGPGRFDWKVFLGQHGPGTETPLSDALVRSVVRRSLLHDPVELVPAGSTAGTLVVPFHVYRISGINDTVLFCRSSLGEVMARDVAFDDQKTQLGAGEVQGAIEALMRQHRSCCTLTLAPGNDWRYALESLPPDKDARVCFLPGDFHLDSTAVIAGKKHVVITGSGRGTRIVASNSEAALLFRNCASVSLAQLSIQGGVAKVGRREHLNGALTVESCPLVQIENIYAACAGFGGHEAACITIRAAAEELKKESLPVASAIVRNCECRVANGQTGILLVDVARSVVENNVIRSAETVDWNEWMKLPEERQALHRLLASNFHGKRAGNGEASVSFRGGTISFRTPDILKDRWQGIMNGVARIGKKGGAGTLEEIVLQVADRILETSGKTTGMTVGLFDRIFGRLDERSQAAGGTGVAIAGRTVSEIRILHNTIDRFQRPIHVGTSGSKESGESRADRIRAELVVIEGNTARVFLPIPTAEERLGIFVGNAESTVVEKNFIRIRRLKSASDLPVEGIRIFGEYGRRVLVRGNHLEKENDSKGAFTTGITFNPVNIPDLREKRLWIITDNITVSAGQIFEVPSAAVPFVHGLNLNYA